MRSHHLATRCYTHCRERNQVGCHHAPTSSSSSTSSALLWGQLSLHQRGSNILTPPRRHFLAEGMGTRAWAQPGQGWISCLPAQLFPPSLGRQAPFSSVPRQTEARPGATLWFNDKGICGSRRALVKDAPTLGAMTKEDPELNLALLTLE